MAKYEHLRLLGVFSHKAIPDIDWSSKWSRGSNCKSVIFLS